METLRHRAAALAGALAVLAAWITPSIALVAVVIIVRLGMERRTRELAPSCVGGAAWAALLPAAVLQYRHALIPMIESLYWAATNYSQANRSGYGAVFGGLAGLFAGVVGGQLPARILLLTPFLLPALLPPLMAIAWLPALRNPRRPEVYLLLCGGALVGSAYPRWDLLHLLYVSPLFLVLAAVWLERARWGMGRAAIFLLLFIPAGAMCARSLMGDDRAISLDTAAGRVRVSRDAASPLRMCLANVRAGSSLFVFPYEPVFYFLTGGENPTRYAWLQPGMMSAGDERTALEELTANPPEWVLYRDVAAADYLRIWPGSDPARLRMASIEGWIRANYRRQASAASSDGVRELWRLR